MLMVLPRSGRAAIATLACVSELRDLPVLDAAEQRVLGSILEKEITVPASYPMSVNSVRTACNQSSSRDPVVDYDDTLVHHVLRALKKKDLVAATWQDSGRRTLKYLQRLDVDLGLAADERALLTVLLLRGAQPPGALRTRTERLHGFADRDQVEECLHLMAGREQPLVQQLTKRPREQDARWIHLLGPVDLGTLPTAPSVDRESVLAAGPEARDAKVRSAYGALAESYAAELSDELGDLPFESWLLRRVVDLAGGAPVIEVGAGPGHVAAFLADAGADATGMDVAPEMVEEARSRHPDVTYEVGDLRRLMRPTTCDGWGAVLAWYSLIHLAASELPGALDALIRPLRPGGWLVLAIHAGDEVLTSSSWFGHAIDLDFVLHEPAGIVSLVTAAGLTDLEWYHRGPFTNRGETTERFYLLARKVG